MLHVLPGLNLFTLQLGHTKGAPPQGSDMEEPVPAVHIGGRPLYGSMMKSIDAGHTFGNRVRMVKLPLIFLDEERWAGAITQFFLLS